MYQASGLRTSQPPAASWRAAAASPNDTPTRHAQPGGSADTQQPQLSLESIRTLMQQEVLRPLRSDILSVRQDIGALATRVDNVEQAQREQHANNQATMSTMQAQHQQDMTQMQRKHAWDMKAVQAQLARVRNNGALVVSVSRTAPAGTQLDADAIKNQLRVGLALGQVPGTSRMGSALKVQLPASASVDIGHARTALAANPHLYVRPYFSPEESVLREAAMLFVQWASSHERLSTMCTFAVWRRQLYVHEGADADPNSAAGWALCDWLYAHVDWVSGRPVLADLDADMIQQRALQSLAGQQPPSVSGQRRGGRSPPGGGEGLTGDWEHVPQGGGRSRRRDSGNMAAAGLTPNTRPQTMMRTGLQGAAGAQRRATQSEPSSPSRTAAGSQGTQSGAHLPRQPPVHARRHSSGTGAGLTSVSGPAAGAGPSGAPASGAVGASRPATAPANVIPATAAPAGQTAPVSAAPPAGAPASTAPAAATSAPAAAPAPPTAPPPVSAAVRASAAPAGVAPAPARAQNALQSAHSAPASLTGNGGGRGPGGRHAGQARVPSGRGFPPTGGRGRGRQGPGGGGAGGQGPPPDSTSEGRQNAGGERAG